MLTTQAGWGPSTWIFVSTQFLLVGVAEHNQWTVCTAVGEEPNANFNYSLAANRLLNNGPLYKAWEGCTSTLVITRIDCCNAILASLPASSLASLLQQVHNAATWLLLGFDRGAHVMHALKHLHWLPVKYRILFKLATLMHRCPHHCCPSYLMDIVTFYDSDSSMVSPVIDNTSHCCEVN